MGAGKKEVEAVFREHAEADGGVLDVKKLFQVMDALKLPATAHDLVIAQGAMRELYPGGDIFAEGIPFDLFWAWYKLEVTPGSFEKHNELLVRRVIGKVKLPTRNLKDNQFSYGQKNQADPEGAGEVVLNWVPGKLSESQEAGVCLIKVNKAAVKNKHLTPKAVNQFLRDNKNAPGLQRPKIVGRKKDRGFKRDPNATYGTTSAAESYHEDMQKIIFPEDRFTGGEDTGEHYVDTSGQMRKGRLPKPRPTKCSDILQQHTRTEREQKEAPPAAWKMSKFEKKAKAKIQMGN